MKEGFDIRKALFPDKRGEPIAPALKELRNGTYALPDSELHPDDMDIPESDKAKTEAYAISGYITEKVHPAAASKARASIQNTESGHIYGARPLDFFESLAAKEHLYPSAFKEALGEWREAAWTDANSYDSRALERLENLLSETDVRPMVIGRDGMTTAEYFIYRGADTAAKMSWGVLRAIPVAFYRNFGHIISPEEFASIATNSQKVLLQLASMHISRFTELNMHSGLDAQLLSSNILFALNTFAISKDESGKYKMDFNEDTLQKFMESNATEMDTSELRVGCPARDVPASNKEGKTESVIQDVHKLYIELAERFLVPNLELYTQGALQKLEIIQR